MSESDGERPAGAVVAVAGCEGAARRKRRCELFSLSTVLLLQEELCFYCRYVWFEAWGPVPPPTQDVPWDSGEAG